MNKEAERRYLDAFVELRPDLAIGDIRDSESPDFLCCVDGITTGIEMTRFFFPASGPVPPQAVSRYRERLSSILSEEHARRGLPLVHVSLHLFSEDKLVSGRTRPWLASPLLDYVALHIPPVGQRLDLDCYSLPAELTDLGIGRISVIRNAALTKPSWSLPYAAFIPESHSSLIQSILASKCTRAAKYREKVSSLWLLIISGSDGLHSVIDFDGDVLTASYISSFDRVFLFRTLGSSIHELRTAEH